MMLPLDLTRWTERRNQAAKQGNQSTSSSSRRPGPNNTHAEVNVTESTPNLLNRELLSELQAEVGELEQDRGTANESIVQKGLILSEEAFEVLKLLRPRAGIATSKGLVRSLSDELADILFVSAAVANRVHARVEDLWPACEVAGCLTEGSRHVSDVDQSAAVLSASIDLAQQVLVVVVGCREYDKEADVKSGHKLIKNLRLLLELVQAVALVCQVDLNEAVIRKLNKDQLRLWST